MIGQNGNMGMGNNAMNGQNFGGNISTANQQQMTGNIRGASTFIPGRFVMNEDEISGQEVPMDGTLCLFPRSDFKAIYARQWTAQGLAAIRYVPEQAPQNQPSSVVDLDGVYQRMDELESKIDKLISKSNRQYYKNKAESKKGD